MTNGEALQISWGLFKKEWTLQLSHWLIVLNRLLLGPLIAFVTTALLYSSFFGIYPEAAIGEVTLKSYRSFIIFGFLGHMFLNAGYHSVSGKLVSEWANRTLPLLWLAPCSRLSLIFSLLSVEIIRCLAIFCIAVPFLDVALQRAMPSLLLEISVLFLTFVFGSVLGVFRTALIFTHLGKAELLDNIYLIFVFTACPYIPGLALSHGLQRVVALNPVHYALQSLREFWMKSGHPWASLGLFLLGGSVLILVLGGFLWNIRKKVLESAFQ